MEIEAYLLQGALVIKHEGSRCFQHVRYCPPVRRAVAEHVGTPVTRAGSWGMSSLHPKKMLCAGLVQDPPTSPSCHAIQRGGWFGQRRRREKDPRQTDQGFAPLHVPQIHHTDLVLHQSRAWGAGSGAQKHLNPRIPHLQLQIVLEFSKWKPPIISLLPCNAERPAYAPVSHLRCSTRKVRFSIHLPVIELAGARGTAVMPIQH